MQQVKIRFKRVEVLKIDTKYNQLHLNFVFQESGIEGSVRKIMPLSDNNTNSVIHGVYSDIRNSVSGTLDSDDPWESRVSIVFVEEEKEDVSERLSVAIKRLKEKINHFRSNNTSDGYLNRWTDIKELKVEL